MPKIIDNPSTKKLLEELGEFETLEGLYKAFPFAQKLFPNAEGAFAKLQQIKEQSKFLLIPDKFNEAFSSEGWIAYESMNVPAMEEALTIKSEQGLEKAETFLANYYDAENLKWGIMRFHGHQDFRKRIRLAELAKEDYLEERYHACIPLLLALIDGLVNDISKHVGFFAEGSNVTAWDSVAAHETGLKTIAKIMGLGRNGTNEESISLPYRNGILHGRELAFDNKVVAAKCWATLFAVKDWANSVRDAKDKPQDTKEPSLAESFEKLSEVRRMRKKIENWRPRSGEILAKCLPATESNLLPNGSPEKSAAEFLEHWISKRYGLMADVLVDYLDTPRGKKAGQTKSDFGNTVLVSYRIIAVEDKSAFSTDVTSELIYQRDGSDGTNVVILPIIYHDVDESPLFRGCSGGHWKIHQNAFHKLIS